MMNKFILLSIIQFILWSDSSAQSKDSIVRTFVEKKVDFVTEKKNLILRGDWVKVKGIPKNTVFLEFSCCIDNYLVIYFDDEIVANDYFHSNNLYHFCLKRVKLNIKKNNPHELIIASLADSTFIRFNISKKYKRLIIDKDKNANWGAMQTNYKTGFWGPPLESSDFQEAKKN